MPTKTLQDFQIKDLAFYMNHPRCANLSDPGARKTGSVCVYIEYLWTRKQTKSYFVMPKSLMKKNKREILEFTNLTEDQVMIIDGDKGQRALQMQDKKAVVFLMGFRRFADDWKTLRNLHPEMGSVLVDEWHMGFKSMTSQQTKAMIDCMRVVPLLVGMSGSLIDGRLDSAYPLIHLIEPRYYTNLWAFRAQHTVVDIYGNVTSWINHAKLGRIFQTHCVRHTFAEVHGAANIAPYHMELCEMAESQRAAYKEFEDTAILELEDKFLEGFNPAVAAMRCRQIMQHPETFGILKPGELTGKDESLLVHLEDHKNKGTPVLIYAVFIPEQERLFELVRKLGFKAGIINANVSTKKRDEYDLAFQRGELDVLIASPATAGVGYNWTHVDHIIFTSLDYQDTNLKQAIMRAVRGTRTTPLRVTILEYENSLDQRIFFIVNRKSADANKVDNTYEKLDIGVKDGPAGSLILP